MQDQDTYQAGVDAVTLARVDAASRREAKRLANLSEPERQDEDRRTALPTYRTDNKPFSIFKS